ncbi:MAG TPA: ABC transporter permease [Actinomycetota bacterium]|nr:ABC transporter permease [Actinomycetota bacterium]
MSVVGNLLANPWRKHRFLALYTWLYLAWAIVPVVIAIGFSFNAGRSRSVWQGFSLEWWIHNPDLSVLHDPTLTSAIRQSLVLAVATMCIATPIGVALALGLARWRGRGSGSANFLMLLPLVTPEIVLATGIFFTVVFLYPFPDPGTTGQIFGHVTWSIPYVVVVLRGRIFSVGADLEEAAMDLGAPPLDALRRVLLPALTPAVFAAFTIVFALSIDDFVTSQFLSTDLKTQTVPMLIYSSGRTAPNPALNATATLMLVISLPAIGVGLGGMRVLSKRQGVQAESSDVANIRL